MKKKLPTLARMAIYLLAFVMAPVLVGAAGINAAVSGIYDKPEYAVGEAPAPPEHDATKPTAVVLMSNEGAQVTDVLAPYEVLSESGIFNVYAVAPRREAVPLTPTREAVSEAGDLDVLPQLSLEELDRRLEGADPDVIVVPATSKVGSAEHRPVEEWLKENSQGDTTVLSVCNGAEVLADAGLLDGRRATANWAGIDGFEKRYPEVDWVRGLRYVEEGNVVTTAGVTSGVNGTLHVVSRFVGDDAAEDLADRIGYPDERFGSSPEIPLNRMTPGDAALFMLNAAYGWHKPSVGVVLDEGVGEIELASVFDVYPGQAFTANVTTLAPGGPRTTIRSDHGLAFVPRFGLEDAPELDRLLVPGRAAPSVTDPALGAWAREHGLEPEYVHAGSVGSAAARFPFDATLADLAEHENVPTARFTARALEYPTGHMALAGPGWPFSRLLRPLVVGLLGLAIAVGLDRSLTALLASHRRKVARRRSQPDRPPGPADHMKKIPSRF